MLVIENEDIDAIKEAKSENIKFLKTPHHGDSDNKSSILFKVADIGDT